MEIDGKKWAMGCGWDKDRVREMFARRLVTSTCPQVVTCQLFTRQDPCPFVLKKICLHDRMEDAIFIGPGEGQADSISIHFLVLMAK